MARGTYISSLVVAAGGNRCWVARAVAICFSRPWSRFAGVIGFVVVGYVVMPEHIHLLVSEPEEKNPSTVMQALKLGLRDASWRGRSGNVNRRKAVCSAMPRDTSGKSGFTISMSGRNGNASRSCAICIAIR